MFIFYRSIPETRYTFGIHFALYATSLRLYTYYYDPQWKGPCAREIWDVDWWPRKWSWRHIDIPKLRGRV